MEHNKHEGTNFFDYLKEEGIYEEVQELATKRYGHLEQKRKVNLFGKIKNLLSCIVGFLVTLYVKYL